LWLLDLNPEHRPVEILLFHLPYHGTLRALLVHHAREHVLYKKKKTEYIF
jgi:hypothetical protein